MSDADEAAAARSGRRRPGEMVFGLVVAVVALWVFPYFANLPNYYGYGISILVPAGLAVYGVLQVFSQRQRTALKAA